MMKPRNLISILIQAGKLFVLALSLTFMLGSVALAAEPASITTSSPLQLNIPSLNLNSPIVSVGWREVTINDKTYSQYQVDQASVGWHNLSAKPGQVGNTVLNGHSNTYGRVFRNLPNIGIGAEITIRSTEVVYTYIVTEKILVQEVGVSMEQRVKNAQFIMPTEDERLTLITCAQPGATHRLIVIARSAAK